MSQIIILNKEIKQEKEKEYFLTQTNIKLTEKAVKQFYQALLSDEERKEYIRICIRGRPVVRGLPI